MNPGLRSTRRWDSAFCFAFQYCLSFPANSYLVYTTRTGGMKGCNHMVGYLLIVVGVLYYLFPYDLLPDFLPGIGRIDDLLMLAYLYWIYYKKYKQSPREESGPSSNGRGNGNERPSGYGSNPGRRPQENRDPYRILGTDRHASLDEIKHAYRIQAARYHPDKVSHLGEEFQALAKQKFQDIQWAYEQVMKGRV
jgi:hypothetical protein